MAAGVCLQLSGRVTGNMGVDCGDYNNDGWLDFFVTTYQAELPILTRTSATACSRT